jgi:hypothetical protein
MTQQIRDKLIYDGKEYYLNNEILEYYFDEFPKCKPESNSIMTACWRGYCATFEIINNELIIKEFDLLDWFETDSEEKLKFDLFPKTNILGLQALLELTIFEGNMMTKIMKKVFMNYWKLKMVI